MSSSSNRQFQPPLAVLEPALLVLLPLAVVLCGGVHTGSRLALAAFAIVVGTALSLRSRFAVSRSVGAWIVGALAIAAFPLIPVGPSVRALLMGDLAGPVESVVDLAGRGWRPLALEPWLGLLGWAEAVSVALLGVGVAGWATRAGRSKKLIWVAVGTGCGAVAIMVAHMLLELESVYAMGPGAGNREGFFAPFVNPNHGGIFMAALMPLALTRVIDGRPTERVLAALSMGALGFGVWASGSRGAVIAVVMGVAGALAVGGGRRLRGAVLGGGALSAVGIVLAGPQRFLASLSAWVAPSVSEMVDAGYVGLTTGRIGLLEAGWSILKNVPVVGVGPGGFSSALRIVRDDTSFNAATHAHNEYLQFAVEHGVVAFGLGAIAVTAVIRMGLGALGQWSDRPDRRWMLAGWLGSAFALAVASFADFPLRLHSHAILAAIALGSLVGLARPQRGGRSLAAAAKRTVVVGGLAGIVALGAVFHGHVGPWSNPNDFQHDGEAWIQALKEGAPKEEGLAAAAEHFERAAFYGLKRDSFQWLARVRMLQGQAAEADRVLDIGTTLDPTMPWLWRDRARLAQRTEDGDLARQSWAKMLALDLPASVDPMDVMHEAFFGGEFASPIEQARAILPERPDRYRQAARVMDQLGLQEESETLFRRALSMDATGVNYYAEALMKWGRPHDAVMLLEPNLKGCLAHRNYAHGLLRLGRYSSAAEAFQSAIRACGARSWELRKGLCYARLMSGDSRGEDAVEALLEERSNSHQLRRAWLWILSRRGRTVDGVRHLSALKDMGVLRVKERAALERAEQGLPYVIDEPNVRLSSPETVVP